jgi:hypothetical protein
MSDAAHELVPPAVPYDYSAATRRRRPVLQVWACQHENPKPVRVVGDITLMEAWTSINPDRGFERQMVEIAQETRNSRLERDGSLSVTCQPMRVTWFGGNIADLLHVERVKIVSRGVTLIETSLCLGPGSVTEIAGGVSLRLVAVP